MSDLSSQDLAAIQARVDAATTGPWYRVGPPWNHDTPYVISGHDDPHVGAFVADMVSFGEDPDDKPDRDLIADAEFIAHARTDVPALLAEVARLQGRVDQQAEHLDKVGQIHNGCPNTNDDLDCPWCRIAEVQEELRAFKPQPMSQRCRDGHHNGVGDEACINCWCLCHSQDAKIAELQAARDVLTDQVAGRDATIQRVRDVALQANEKWGLLRPTQILRALGIDPTDDGTQEK